MKEGFRARISYNQYSNHNLKYSLHVHFITKMLQVSLFQPTVAGKFVLLTYCRLKQINHLLQYLGLRNDF